MVSLSTFSLPLPTNGPPNGYGLEERDMSIVSSTTRFIAGIKGRDTFFGERCCVVCGITTEAMLKHCYIIPESEPYTWANLKNRHWIPTQAKSDPRHEPRNGLVMCGNHCTFFNSYAFFIRFSPETRKFVFVNYSNAMSLRQFHGKAIALDISDHYVPFPALFIVHEMRVRGVQVFQPIFPEMPHDTHYQDWILSDRPDDHDDNDNDSFPVQLQLLTMSAGGPTSSGPTLALNEDVVTEILAATRMMPSWKACVTEGTSWAGTTEENIEKYVSTIGVEE